MEKPESLVLGEHLEVCPVCRAEIDALGDFYREMVGACAMHRLQRSLCDDVLAHLPELDPALDHGSHPTDPRIAPRRYSFRLPLAFATTAAVLLAVLLGIILYAFQLGIPAVETIGMVVYTDGPATLRKAANDPEFEPVSVMAQVRPGEVLETLDDSQMEVALSRGTSLKMNAHTRLTVHDHRSVFVHQGQAYFDVGRGRRHFFVNTPTGEILVFSTTFVVDVSSDVTTVTVVEGDVIVSTQDGRSALSNGKMSALRLGEAPSPPTPVSDNSTPPWAASMVPDAIALSHFRQSAASLETTAVTVPAEAVYAVRNLRERTVDGIMVQWNDDGITQGHCGYFLHVSDSNDTLLYLDTIDGNVFDNDAVQSLTLTPSGGPISGVDVLHIRLIPDYDSGTAESNVQVNVVVR